MIHLIAKAVSAMGWFTTHDSNLEDVIDILADGGTIKEAMTALAVSNCYFHNGEMDEVPFIHEPSRFWRLFGYTKQDVIDYYQG